MKISKKKLALVLVPLVAGALFTFACGFISLLERSESYSSTISKWNIDAELKDNGDLHVVDTIEFKSDGFHFFEYEFGYAKNIIEGSGSQSYFDEDSISVSVYNKKGDYYFNEAIEQTSNATSFFKTENCLGFSWQGAIDHEGESLTRYTYGKDRELVYVYLPDGLDSTIYFKYEYVIKNAANKYEDVTELNWNFASPLEEIATKNISLNLKLPEKCSEYNTSESWDEKGILAFGHGNGNSEIVEFTNQNIKIETSRLKSNTDDVLELRVVIPNDPVDAFNRVSSDNMISLSSHEKNGFNILKNEEERLTKLDQSITNEYTSKKSIVIIINIIAIAVLIPFIFLIYFKFDKERKPKFDGYYLREPPSKIIPSELSYLMYEKDIVTVTFNAVMISLARKKYLVIDSNGSLLTDEKANYLIKKGDETQISEELNYDEKCIYDLFFNKMFKDQDSFTMEDLEKKLRKEKTANQYMNALDKWRREAKEKAKKLKYFDNLSAVSGLLLFPIIGIIASIYCAFFYLTYYLPFSLLVTSAVTFMLSLFILAYVPSITRKSKVGIEEYAKWSAFKKFLCDFSHFEDYDMMSVIIWEEYLVYASVFGVADLVEKQIRVKLKDLGDIEENNNSFSYDFFMLYHLNRLSRRMTFYSVVARQTVVAARAAKVASAAGHVASSGRFGGSSSFGGGGHGGRAG